MQAMKVEKDNACDRVDVCEEQCKAARVSLHILSKNDLLHLDFFWDLPCFDLYKNSSQLRASKAEDEVEELVTKARQLETELDLTVEKLGIATLQLEEKEKALSASELEMNALTRWGIIPIRCGSIRWMHFLQEGFWS